MMAVRRTLAEVGDHTRTLHLFDTFEGMVAPGPHDRLRDGSSAAEIYAGEARDGGWCAASLNEVKAVMSLIRQPPDRIRYVVGRVEDTLRSKHLSRSRCSASTPTGTSRPATSWSASTPVSFLEVDHRRLRLLGRRPPGRGRVPGYSPPSAAAAPDRRQRQNSNRPGS